MKFAILFVIALAAAACQKEDDELASDGWPKPVATAGNKLYLDTHAVGPGKVSLADVAGAHAKDLATQAKYGVDFKAYWVDEQLGKICCLVEAPNAEAVNAVHKEAHGLLADSIEEVTEGR